MKKLWLIIFIFVIMSAVSGCIVGDVLTDMANNQQHSKEVSEKIIRYINDKDIESMEDLFSPYAKKSKDLKDNIEELFDCVDGKIVSYEIDYNGETGEIDNGKWKIQTAETELEKIKTDEDKEYFIRIHEHLVYSEDEEKEGIYFIALTDEEGNVLYTILYE